MDAGCTASGILPAHLVNQISDLARNDRSPRLAASHFRGPEEAKGGAMPSYNAFRLDDGQCCAPVAPESGESTLPSGWVEQ
jgi:hypothetical protein